jgi:hypothetical protein
MGVTRVTLVEKVLNARLIVNVATMILVLGFYFFCQV